MCLLVRRQKLCRRERKIIKAHYMLAYECGLRRLRSGRVAHWLSDYNRHIACGSVYLCIFTINNHTHRVFDYLKKCFLYFNFVFFIFVSIKKRGSNEVLTRFYHDHTVTTPRPHRDQTIPSYKKIVKFDKNAYIRKKS